MIVKLKVIRRCNEGAELPRITNYAVTISKSTTVGEIVEHIKKILILPEKKIWISEVNKQRIIRHIFPGPSKYFPISYFRTIGIRKDSDLYVYETFRSLEDCRATYSQKVTFKRSDKVDAFDPKKGKWVAGTLVSTTWKTIGGKLAIVNEVCIEDNGEILRVENERLAPYLSRSSFLSEVISLPMYNRYFKSKDSVKYLEFPKMISFGSWCSCSQVVSEILLQARHFISFYTTSGARGLNRNFSASIKKTHVFEARRSFAKPNSVPFKITLIDTNTGQCAICSSKELLEGDTGPRKLCTGCSLPNENIPIRNIVKYFGDLVICLDWTDLKEYGLQDETDDSSVKLLENKDKLEPSLYDCFKLFSKTERVEGYRCDNCNEVGVAEITPLISKAPDILVIQLKRFKSTESYIDKLDAFIKCPTHKLSLSDYVVVLPAESPQKTHKNEYDLYAVANHHSCIPSGGHYTAVVQSESAKGVWVHCNDTILGCCTDNEVITNDAYLLFYKRRVMTSSNIINLTYQSFG